MPEPIKDIGQSPEAKQESFSTIEKELGPDLYQYGTAGVIQQRVDYETGFTPWAYKIPRTEDHVTREQFASELIIRQIMATNHRRDFPFLNEEGKGKFVKAAHEHAVARTENLDTRMQQNPLNQLDRIFANIDAELVTLKPDIIRNSEGTITTTIVPGHIHHEVNSAQQGARSLQWSLRERLNAAVTAQLVEQVKTASTTRVTDTQVADEVFKGYTPREYDPTYPNPILEKVTMLFRSGDQKPWFAEQVLQELDVDLTQAGITNESGSLIDTLASSNLSVNHGFRTIEMPSKKVPGIIVTFWQEEGKPNYDIVLTLNEDGAKKAAVAPLLPNIGYQPLQRQAA